MSKRKTIVSDEEYIECPYCPKEEENKFKLLHWKHLKKQHNKTLDDVAIEFPNHPTISKSEYERRKLDAKKNSNINKQQKNKTKIIYCNYFKDNDCPGNPIEVSIFSPTKITCPTCLELGKEEVDPRKTKLVKEKRKSTLIKKYGVDNVQKIKEIKEKTMNTCNIKYGGTGFSSKELAKKTKEKIYNKYNTTNIMQSDIGKELFKKSMMFKYGEKITNPLHIKKVSEYISKLRKGSISKLKGRKYEDIFGNDKALKLKQNKSRNNIKEFLPILKEQLTRFDLELQDEYIGAHLKLNFKCKKCNHIFTQIWNAIQQGFDCPICNPRNNGKSKAECELAEYISSLEISIERNNRKIIYPKELDIYIPDKKLAIEFNGLYWHSENNINNNRDIIDFKSYHLNKTNECEKQGIQLIHIFEDEWIFKQDIVKSRLKQILGVNDSLRIHARKCQIKEIDSKTKNEFLEKYHIQGKDNSVIKLGAFHQNELIAVMTFSHGNISKGSKSIDGVWELNRFAINNDYHIPGIASKLLKHFQRNYEWKQIFSYADRRWSQGNVYYKLGFELDSITNINYWYIQNYKRIHRFALRKKPDEPRDIPEWILRYNEGYSRIWDCGNLKFIIKK